MSIAKPTARHLVRARDLADSRYTEEVTVDDMAQAALMSRPHFNPLFKKAFGESPHACRLTAAIHLLGRNMRERLTVATAPSAQESVSAPGGARITW